MAASVLFPTSFVSPEKFLMLALALAEKCCPQVIIGRFAVLAPSTRIKNNAVILIRYKQMQSILGSASMHRLSPRKDI